MAVTIDVALVNLLRITPAVMDQIEGRIYATLAPTQAPFPYLIYFQSAYRSERHMLGVSTLKWATFDFEAFGTPRDQASHVRDAVRDVLDGLRGGYSGVGISQVYLRGVGDTLVDDKGGGQQQLYCSSLQIEVVYYDPDLVDP